MLYEKNVIKFIQRPVNHTRLHKTPVRYEYIGDLLLFDYVATAFRTAALLGVCRQLVLNIL